MRGRTQRGSATVLAAGIVAVLALCAGGVCALLSAVEASHRARTAADLAALAAAGTLLDPGSAGGSPCAAAASMADANGALLRRCTPRGDTVTVSVDVDAAFPGLGTATARARAGPGGEGPGPAPRHTTSW